MTVKFREAAGRPQLYLIRHGRTEWTVSGQHTGSTDIPLTPEGEAQARSVAAHLDGLSFDHVLSSPRQRAQKTCQLAGLGARMQVDPDLAEWDYGDYEGLTSRQIAERRPGWNVFRDGPPNGETPEAITARADRPKQTRL